MTKNTRTSGQALVSLLTFMVIGVTVISAGVVLIVNATRSTSAQQESMLARQIAESGAENAMIRFLRDPSYSGETLTIGGGTATITVTGTSPVIITSTGRKGDYVRKIQVTASDINNMLTTTSWKEVF